MNNIFLKETIIAHRGIHDNKKIYENTLEAFKKALKKQYIIELDVHLTKDNIIVVFHDYNLKRLTGINKIIENTTYKELNQQELFHIPTLEETLKLVKGQVPLLIEIKQNSKVGPLEEKLMTILKNYKGKYAIQSFNVMTIYWFKKNYPTILRGQLSSQYRKTKMNKVTKFILKNMLLNYITKPDFISYKYDELSPKKIKKYKRKGIILLAWIIDNKEDYNQYKNQYDNLICEKFINK